MKNSENEVQVETKEKKILFFIPMKYIWICNVQYTILDVTYIFIHVPDLFTLYIYNADVPDIFTLYIYNADVPDIFTLYIYNADVADILTNS